MREWDKMEKREGNKGCLKENKATRVAETTFLGSRDDRGAANEGIKETLWAFPLLVRVSGEET